MTANTDPLPTHNLDQLSMEQLWRQQEEIQQKLEARQLEVKREAIRQIVEVVKEYNISIEELIEALGGFKPKRPGIKAKAKYRNPVTNVTWSGRGKEPLWMRGHSRDEFLIKY